MSNSQVLCEAADLFLPGPTGALQARLQCPATETQAGVIICHPHPLYGGNFDNKVVHILARSFLDLGMFALRFNFRGVGQSAGEFDHGEGENADLLAVCAWARAHLPARTLWLAGFSFGAYVALRSHLQVAPQGLILVAPALRYCRDDEECRLGSLPSLVIQGAHDTVVTPHSVEAWLRAQIYPSAYRVLDSGHFFHGHLNEVRDIVQAWQRDNQD
jgi:uncharacterized protein